MVKKRFLEQLLCGCSVGRRPGVWKDKFESARCAVLLEAFGRLNRTHQKHFSTQSDAPGAPWPACS